MKTKAQLNALETRRFYAFEETVLDTRNFPALNKQLSRAALKKHADQLLDFYQTILADGAEPTIEFGSGTRHGAKWVSYQQGNMIVLAPGQRDLVTLCHELAHFIHDNHPVLRSEKELVHGEEFRSIYFDLLGILTTVDWEPVYDYFIHQGKPSDRQDS